MKIFFLMVWLVTKIQTLNGEKPAANPYKNAAEILDCCRLEKLAVCSSFLQVIHALFLSKKELRSSGELSWQ
jgi:hypothetical protein